MEQPYGSYTPPPSYGYPPPAPPTNGLAIASLVLSLLGLIGVLPLLGTFWASSSATRPATRLPRARAPRAVRGWRRPVSSSAG